jgi:hypothetical protein
MIGTLNLMPSFEKQKKVIILTPSPVKASRFSQSFIACLHLDNNEDISHRKQYSASAPSMHLLRKSLFPDADVENQFENEPKLDVAPTLKSESRISLESKKSDDFALSSMSPANQMMCENESDSGSSEYSD